ncbi:uncharacterized protein LOC111541468 [Piliocolobus tephrosceles]|uniref:uncharacterized protein LOC111541468 n=1 Tax=Piliocolobus tephrosceles TaxID=591936 RepID=UPI000C2B26BF|nr:uncharacterized protein LOC111541468 [Piliocolobus tephrosceles]
MSQATKQPLISKEPESSHGHPESLLKLLPGPIPRGSVRRTDWILVKARAAPQLLPRHAPTFHPESSNYRPRRLGKGQLAQGTRPLCGAPADRSPRSAASAPGPQDPVARPPAAVLPAWPTALAAWEPRGTRRPASRQLQSRIQPPGAGPEPGRTCGRRELNLAAGLQAGAARPKSSCLLMALLASSGPPRPGSGLADWSSSPLVAMAEPGFGNPRPVLDRAPRQVWRAGSLLRALELYSGLVEPDFLWESVDHVCKRTRTPSFHQGSITA